MAKKSTTEDLKRGIAKIRSGRTGGRTGNSVGEFAKRVSKDLKWNTQQAGQRMGNARSKKEYDKLYFDYRHQTKRPITSVETNRYGSWQDAYDHYAVMDGHSTAVDMKKQTKNIARAITPGADVAFNMNDQSKPLGLKSKELKERKEAADYKAAKDKEMLAERARGYKKRTGRDYMQDKAKWEAQQKRDSDRAASSLISAGSGVRLASRRLASDMSDKMKAARASAAGRPWESPYRMDKAVPVQQQEREVRRLEPARKAVRSSNRKGRYQQK
jgi:hypothetical protein